MKTFLFIFIFALSLNAKSSLLARCVDSYYMTLTGRSYTINVIYSDTPTSLDFFSYTPSIIAELVNNNNKFSYDSVLNRCNPIMTDSNNQVLISSLTGILIGFTILFFAIFLTIKVGSKK